MTDNIRTVTGRTDIEETTVDATQVAPLATVNNKPLDLPQNQSPLGFLGKIVATRGHASGINLGRCIGIGCNWIVLDAPFYYMKHWDYDKSKGCFGSFHALANGNLTGGPEICKVNRPCSIHAFQHVIECPESLMGLADKYSSQ